MLEKQPGERETVMSMKNRLARLSAHYVPKNVCIVFLFLCACIFMLPNALNASHIYNKIYHVNE